MSVDLSRKTTLMECDREVSVALKAYKRSVSQQARLFLPIDTTRSNICACLVGLNFGFLLYHIRYGWRC